MLYEAPGYDRLLFDTDGGMNPAPDFEQKKSILENAARLLHLLGYQASIAACVSGSETVTEKVQSSVDAKRLSELDWSKYGMTVFGPVGVDLAISPEACEHKRYNAPGCGKADILLMPNMEAGNCFGKALTYFANARSAGLVVGARCPIVLVSRADSAQAKLTSLALGAIASIGGNE
jgi:phosphate butyryltransferase